MSNVLEIAQYRIHPGREDEFLDYHPTAMAAIAEAFPGLIRVNLVRYPDGRFADVALWESRADAERAARECAALPAFQKMEAMISETIGIELGNVVERHG